MKYLILYESYSESINTDKVEKDIKDILVELLDNEFDINFLYNNYSDSELAKNIIIEIDHSAHDWFDLSEIYEDILVVVDYMKEKYPNLKFTFNGEIYRGIDNLSNRLNNKDDSIKRTDLVNYKENRFSYISLNFEK
jgi:hypothetical protein